MSAWNQNLLRSRRQILRIFILATLSSLLLPASITNIPESAYAFSTAEYTAQQSVLDTTSRIAATSPGDASFSLDWISLDSEPTLSVAWGDYDGDGDLDLAVANFKRRNQLYRNDNGTLSHNAIWSSTESDATTSIAWGDYDGDGDLDLAVGNTSVPNRLYRNDNGTLSTDAVWSSTESDETTSIAWGDYDGDGDLDLAVGNSCRPFSTSCQPNRLYRNDGNSLSPSAIWTSAEADNTQSVAWGDYDGDGDLDLAVGNIDAPNRLYRNDNGTLRPDFTFGATDDTTSVAWGDHDNDGDLDLAVGNTRTPNRLYRNDNGTVSADAVWSSTTSSETTSIAWGDYDGDGDLDLVIGNGGTGTQASNQLYRNDNGMLTTNVVWSSAAVDPTGQVAWGDYDSDGDLDLVIASLRGPNRVYENNVGVLASTVEQSIGGQTNVMALAWGDVDSDGDLDLAIANSGNPNQLYRNDNGHLTTSPVWSSNETDYSLSLAWGDYDNDGDLDLAVGNYTAPNRLYRNDNGQLTTNAVWSAEEFGWTRSVAWGDYDNDGDLDLVAGNVGLTSNQDHGQENWLYRNDNGMLTRTPIWSSNESDISMSVAWGDYDSDGDLDLAVGNSCQTTSGICDPNRLYRNDHGTLSAEATWSSSETDDTTSIAWGDYDGDGDLDLAVGNLRQPNRLYRNNGGQLSSSSVWSSVEADNTTSIAWGDYDGDGDLDLAVGNAMQPNRLYRNDNGQLTSSAIWSSVEADETRNITWGDYDGDGDLDLAVGNWRQPSRLYENLRSTIAQDTLIPVVSLSEANSPASTDGYFSPKMWDNGTIQFRYSLFHPSGELVRRVQGFYSLDGGGQWHPAVPSSTTPTTNLSTALFPTRTSVNTHVYSWNVFDSGVMGQSDNVVFRLVAYPTVSPKPGQAVGTFQQGSYSAQTARMRIRGTQVRVLNNGQPVANAMVFRLAAGLARGAQPLGLDSRHPFRTNTQGFLEGNGQIAIGDQLISLQPVETTDRSTLYYTSAAPTESGLEPYIVTDPGLQTLTVSPAHPLLLFNLKVSLEWDARTDIQFLNQLQFDLKRTSELLYDWTNGQIALAQITVYHDKQHWDDADVRVYGSNRLRPTATQGGIVTTSTSDPDNSEITYDPGHVRMGAVWNRFGDAGNSLSEDWPRTLAHELGHYAFFLDDNYLGVDEQGLLLPIDTCSGTAMTDPYRDDYSEFHPGGAHWTTNCAQTLAALSTGRHDWQTITTFYPALHQNPANPGPSGLPLEVTQVTIMPYTATTPLEVPLFYLSQNGGRVQPGSSARAILFQGDRVTDLGRPVQDQVLARGARPNDRLCVYELGVTTSRIGCKMIQVGDTQLELVNKVDWRPELIVTPVTSRTIDLQVLGISQNLTLKAKLFPSNTGASNPITLSSEGTQYTGRFNLATPALEGYIQLWVEEPTPRREIVTNYALGGNPGVIGARGGVIGARGVPAVATDGLVTLFGEHLKFGKGTFVTLQSATTVPSPPAWGTVIGQGYRLAASNNAPELQGSSISFNYLGSEVPPGEESGLRMYYWDGTTWNILPTRLDLYHNFATAPVQGPGLYALMSSTEVKLTGPGWNLFAYSVPNASPSTALSSINGAYTTVYGYEPSDTADPWKVFDIDVPGWVNDLKSLKQGQAYWIYVTNNITLLLRGGTESASMSTAASNSSDIHAANIPQPPATYYGSVLPSSGFTPLEGKPVHALIKGVVCGQGYTLAVDGQIMYVLDVLPKGAGSAANCGSVGETVTFMVDGQPMAGATAWDNSRVHNRTLSTTPIFYIEQYLPLVVGIP